MNKRLIAAVLGGAALAVPSAAAADAGHGKADAKRGSSKVATTPSKGKAKKVTFVFKGSFAADGTVQVRSGNAHARKGGYVGQAVRFDFAGAKVVAADTNGDQHVDLTDVKTGDAVLVKARLSKGTKFAVVVEGETAEPLAARQLIDRTNAPAEE